MLDFVNFNNMEKKSAIVKFINFNLYLFNINMNEKN